MEALKLEPVSVRATLERFERAKILEVYFARVDGRVPQFIPRELRPLYDIELAALKSYLLGQHPQDTLLTKIFNLIS